MNPSTEYVSFIKSQKGKNMAVLGSYTFTEIPTVDQSKQIWKCSSAYCLSRLWTQRDTNKVIKDTDSHNHAPEHEPLIVKVAINKMKDESIANLDSSINDLISRAEQSLPSFVKPIWPRKKLTRQTLSRHRKKIANRRELSASRAVDQITIPETDQSVRMLFASVEHLSVCR